MSHELKQNLKVMGETQSSGGTFDKVSIMGECSVTGSIDANSCKVMGDYSVSEDLSCDYFRNMGEVTIGGRLAAAESRLIGETHVEGECVLQQASIYGEFFAARGLTGEEMKVRGALHVTGNVSLEKLDMQGGINVEGLLNCDEIDIALKFNSDNYVKEIGAGRVSVKRRRTVFGAAPTRKFRAEIIEGDHVSLEYTKANVVRGVDVEIGEGCAIDRVEYSGSYKTSGKFKVGQTVRLTADEK